MFMKHKNKNSIVSLGVSAACFLGLVGAVLCNFEIKSQHVNAFNKGQTDQVLPPICQKLSKCCSRSYGK